MQSRRRRNLRFSGPFFWSLNDLYLERNEFEGNPGGSRKGTATISAIKGVGNVRFKKKAKREKRRWSCRAREGTLMFWSKRASRSPGAGTALRRGKTSASQRNKSNHRKGTRTRKGYSNVAAGQITDYSVPISQKKVKKRGEAWVGSRKRRGGKSARIGNSIWGEEKRTTKTLRGETTRRTEELCSPTPKRRRKNVKSRRCVVQPPSTYSKKRVVAFGLHEGGLKKGQDGRYGALSNGGKPGEGAFLSYLSLGGSPGRRTRQEGGK